jgi:hypothetical protein
VLNVARGSGNSARPRTATAEQLPLFLVSLRQLSPASVSVLVTCHRVPSARDALDGLRTGVMMLMAARCSRRRGGSCRAAGCRAPPREKKTPSFVLLSCPSISLGPVRTALSGGA